MSAPSLPQSLQRLQIPRATVVLLLLLLIVVGAIPGYLTGKWSWNAPPSITTLKDLKAVRETGLSIPGWQSLGHRTETISGRKWLIQAIAPQTSQAADSPTEPVQLLLLPPNSNRDQPGVEWTDMNLVQRWTIDSVKQVQFTVNQPVAPPSNSSTIAPVPSQNSIKVEAKFARGWNQERTYAVLQWYAWPKGGSPEPGQWFWADRLAQLHKSRQPWVAVCILIPIEPLGDIETVRPLAASLGQAIQATLMAGPLRPPV